MTETTLRPLYHMQPDARRDAIKHLGEAIMKMEDEYPADIELHEYFCNGVYGREIRIAAGTTFVGEEHLEANLSIIIEGEIEVATADGVQTLYGGDIFASPAGVQRACFAVRDTRWIIVIASDKTDGEAIRQEKIKNPRDFGDSHDIRSIRNSSSSSHSHNSLHPTQDSKGS